MYVCMCMVISWTELLGICIENEWKILQLTREFSEEQFLRAAGQKRQHKKSAEDKFANGLVKKKFSQDVLLYPEGDLLLSLTLKRDRKSLGNESRER